MKSRREASAAFVVSAARTKRMNVNLNVRVHDRFKAAAAADGKKMSEVVLDLIQDYLRRPRRAVDRQR